MIEAAGLTRYFGTNKALSDLSFRVEPGEIVGFLGPNGAGKTTTMRILTCTLPPSAGRAAVAGFDVVTEADAVRSRVGFMPENVPLYGDATIDELLRFVADLKGVPRAGRGSHIDGVIERVGVAEVRSRLVGNLSKGYRQRVGLAQALIGDPDILILDEPSVGLDPHQIVEVRELIRGFRGEKTVLLSSHILNEVSLICSRVMILDRGRLVAEESPAAMARRKAEGPRIALAWSGDRSRTIAALAGLPGVGGVLPTADGAEIVCSGDANELRPRLAAAVIESGAGLQSMRDIETSLEDLFLELTGSGGDKASGAGEDAS